MSTITALEDYSPVYIGDTGAFLAPQFLEIDDTPFPLVGASLSMKMLNIDTGQVNICSGSWAIDDTAKGLAHYQYQAADVATAGIWKLFVTITIGGRPIHADERLLEIKYAP